MFRKKKEEFDTEPETTDHPPLVPYRVLHSEIPFYQDAECRTEVPDARIAILEPQDLSGSLTGLDVVPCRKKYRPGQWVTWLLNHKKGWEESWFRNPESGEIEQAWTYHVEFAGLVLSEKAIDDWKNTPQEAE